MDADKEWTQKYMFDSRSATSGPKAPSSFNSPVSPPRKPQSITDKPLPDTPANSSIPTPLASASPTSSSFHHSNPFSPSFQPTSLLDTPNPRLKSSRAGSVPRIEVSRAPSAATSKRPPPSYRSTTPSGHTSGPSGRARSSSARASNPSNPPSARHRSASHTRTHKRNISLPQKFPGDMSNRPLDMIKKQAKTAHRSGKHRRGTSQPDTIDALDTIGGSYHHDGPYEATLASRNINSKYSPLEAVRDSNMEAIRATPREFIQDSLQRHVPLQGTSSIPNGDLDLGGNVMTYEEGADLMREIDAPGGAYKRWDGIRYHPDDLKGKGEPSFSYERYSKLKAERFLHPGQQPGDVELESRSARHRSLSNGAYDATATGLSAHRDDGMQRSNTTGKRLSDGLKRRLGSLRKKDSLTEQVL